jgi:hypothetical protein
MAAMKAEQERIETQALMDFSLQKIEACLEKIEENQGKVEEIMMEGCLEWMKMVTIGRPIWGMASGCNSLQMAKEMDSRQ